MKTTLFIGIANADERMNGEMKKYPFIIIISQ